MNERSLLSSLSQEVLKYRNYKGSINLILGEQLVKLRDQKQHRNRGYEDFYKYCKECFGLGRKMVNRLVKGTDVAALVQRNFGNIEIEGAPYPIVVSEYQTRYLPEELFANPNHFEDDESLLVDIWSSAVNASKGRNPSPGGIRKASETELKRRRRKNHGNEVISSPKTKIEKKPNIHANNNNNNNTQEHYATEYDDGEFKYVASSPLKSPPLSQQYRSSQESPSITEIFKTPEKKSRCEFATIENLSAGLAEVGGEATGTDLLDWMVKTFEIPHNQKSSYFRRLNVMLGQHDDYFTKAGVMKIADNKITSVWKLNAGSKKRPVEDSVEDEEEPLQMKKHKAQSPPNSQGNDHSLPSTPKIEKSKPPRVHSEDLLNREHENNTNNRHQREDNEEVSSQLESSQKESSQKEKPSPTKRLSGSQEQDSSQKSSSPVKRQHSSSSQERKEEIAPSPSKRHQSSRQSSQEKQFTSNNNNNEIEELKNMMEQLQQELDKVTNKNMELEDEVSKSSQKITSAKKIITKMLESNRVSKRQQIIEELQPEGINDFRGQGEVASENS